jgi:hypothetical protein
MHHDMLWHDLLLMPQQKGLTTGFWHEWAAQEWRSRAKVHDGWTAGLTIHYHVIYQWKNAPK